jgi:uncharacterized protein
MIMGLLEQLQEDYKQAFRDRNAVAKDVLSIVLATIKNKQIESHDTISDQDVQHILLKEQKAIKETISYLEKANRTQAILLEQAKIAVLAKYLPALLSALEVKELVDSAVVTLGIQDIAKERGKLIAYILQTYPGQVDPVMLQAVIY